MKMNLAFSMIQKYFIDYLVNFTDLIKINIKQEISKATVYLIS